MDFRRNTARSINLHGGVRVKSFYSGGGFNFQPSLKPPRPLGPPPEGEEEEEEEEDFTETEF